MTTKHEQAVTENVKALTEQNSEGLPTGIFVRNFPCGVCGEAVFWIETENGFYEMCGSTLTVIDEKRFKNATTSLNVSELKEKV
jgi:hypothetical protein